MKNSTLFKIISLLLVIVVLPSCDLIAGIFKAGVATGIFIVVIIIVAILAIFLNRRYRNRRAGH